MTSHKIIILLIGLSFVGITHARNVYLNGMDISSTRNQKLEKVNLMIDENGQIFIEAEHYQVQEKTSYKPISSWQQKKHSSPQKIVTPDSNSNNNPTLKNLNSRLNPNEGEGNNSVPAMNNAKKEPRLIPKEKQTDLGANTKNEQQDNNDALPPQN